MACASCGAPGRCYRYAATVHRSREAPRLTLDSSLASYYLPRKGAGASCPLPRHICTNSYSPLQIRCVCTRVYAVVQCRCPLCPGLSSW